jgi:DNA-binding NarL/FixJ family response regulator
MSKNGSVETTGRSCVLAARHQAVRESLAVLLEHEGFTVAGMAESGREAIQLLQTVRPDLAVLDLRLRDMSGIEVAREAMRLGLSSAIVIHTSVTGSTLVQEALDAGVRGLALKAVPPTALLGAVAAAAAGEVYVDPAIRGYAAGLAE